MERERIPITVAIPTYGREQVLLDTVVQLVTLERPPEEILVIDQNEVSIEPRFRELRLDNDSTVRWVRHSPPSQPGALNRALRESAKPVVLFIDDDIRVDPDLVAAHHAVYAGEDVWAVAGQVLQPGQGTTDDWERAFESGPLRDMDFPFNLTRAEWIENGMSGNLSVRRDRALEAGGFDENFLAPVSYRFDGEFCKRLVRRGGRIRFEPRARIYHLRAPRGGTRTSGSHLTSASPLHGVGDYYFALRQGLSAATLAYMAQRPFREVMTRFHLRHPWWIPVKFIGELRALALAVRLWREGPKLIGT